ncbi:type IV secretory system conjugative DNA transfer family protein [Mesorhizobium sp. B1-1-8]|uniref:type IV secretory system conjugative DNA transfer family protein n=1 Tax=Mesorhizobium sp. B1-1-8 TaxID=2589976 RepID=UPI00112CD0C0|nr:type IV secretion system DNA-binding domain-containing protein [Mesorhizobium sp. B1-1-8]UCI07333.1 type IV secretion system DNA-binding domain-containing protein [Mesorhizobium sp. B1-1-8]
MAPQNFPTLFGRVASRSDRRVFGLRPTDRFSHVYVIGKTGTGKSSLLETMVLQDMAHGHGVAFIDPHGDIVTRIHDRVPPWRRGDIRYLNVPDAEQPFGYNPLRRVRHERIPLAASGILEAMKKVWGDAWGVRMEHILRNAVFALLEQKNAALSDILRMFSDKAFRKEVTQSLRNPTIRTFWEKEYERYSFGYRADGIASIQNKLGALLSDPTLRRILTAPKEDIRIRAMMDEGRILLVNLAKGQVGEDSASLLGALLVTTVGLAAMSRAEVEQSDRRPFFCYIDEFQSFTTLSVANMFSELRKYNVGMVAAHQYLYQLESDIRHAVLGNSGTVISFRLGAEDAAYLSREFGQVVSERDLLNLANHHIYLKLMIDGMPSKPFSAETLAPT